jgi:WD40-like Beta Propeller Repeat
MVVTSDGSGAPEFFEVGATLGDGPPLYSPDGSEIMFVGRQPGEPNRGVYALNPATSNVRPVVAASATMDIHSFALSPDAKRIAYGTYDPNLGEASARTHVVSADGTGDIVLNTDPERFGDNGTEWSNDGTRLVIAGLYHGDAGDTIRSVVVPIDRSSAGVMIDCPRGAAPDDCTANWIWSPDDSVLLAVSSDAGARPMPLLLADPLTGKIRNAPWSAAGDLAWQRVAK